MANKMLLSILTAAIVVGGSAFYGGMKYAQSQSPKGQFSRANLQNLSPEERQQRIQQFGGLGMGSRSGGLGSRTAAVSLLEKFSLKTTRVSPLRCETADQS